MTISSARTALALLLFYGLFALPQSILAQNDDRLARIQGQQRLRVCIWSDYYTISYRNPRTGELQGIDIDMARALADDLGVELQFVESSFAQLIENMQNESCDIAMHAVGVTEVRKEAMNFSEPHLRSGIYAVSQRNHPAIHEWADIDQPSVVVVVQKGTVMEPIMADYLQQADLSVVDDILAREQEVLSGRADVFMTDYPYGRRMVELTDWAALIEPPELFAPTEYAYAIPLGDPTWLARVNTFVTTVKTDGRLAAAAERHGLTPILAP